MVLLLKSTTTDVGLLYYFTTPAGAKLHRVQSLFHPLQ
jgi:hypothetical protein